MEQLKGYLLPVVCIILIFLDACHSRRDDQNWPFGIGLPPLDTSAVQKGRLANLDDLKGINNWRIGMSKSYYRGAFYDDNAYHHNDSCLANYSFQSFNEPSKATLFFADDTLNSFRLALRCHDIQALVRRLRDLYGEPNSQPFTYAIMSGSNVLSGASLDTIQEQTYAEEPAAIFDSIVTYNGPEIPLYRDNVTHMNYFHEKPWPDSTQSKPIDDKKPIFDMRIQAVWKSQRSLRLEIFREARLAPYQQDSTKQIIHTDYYARLEFQ